MKECSEYKIEVPDIKIETFHGIIFLKIVLNKYSFITVFVLQ